MERYTDTISGEELYVDREGQHVTYYKDKAHKIYHRVDGPAIEYVGGSTVWMTNNKYHRLDGPAKIWANGDTDWYVDGVLIMELDKHGNILSRLGDERI